MPGPLEVRDDGERPLEIVRRQRFEDPLGRDLLRYADRLDRPLRVAVRERVKVRVSYSACRDIFSAASHGWRRKGRAAAAPPAGT